MQTRGPSADAVETPKASFIPAESEGAFSYAQVGKHSGRNIRIYIVPFYGRDADALLPRSLKNAVLRPIPS
jgi:hypothetical protein